MASTGTPCPSSELAAIRGSIDELDRADDAVEDPAIGLKIGHRRDRHGIEERTVAQLRREEDDVLGLAERRRVRHHRAQPAAASHFHAIVPWWPAQLRIA